MQDDQRFTIAPCDGCGTHDGEHDVDCDWCHGRGSELAPILPFDELVDLLAGTEWERTA